MTVTVYGEDYKCASYKRDETSLLLYNAAGTCIVSFAGVSDWSGYEVDGVPIAEIAEENGGTE
jgi:hypothetical protein